MPELEAPKPLQSFNLDIAAYLKSTQTPEEARALELVNQTFSKYEFQRQSREMKWRIADRLYHAQVETRMWEGTDKPRASLAVPLVFDQVESVYPHVVDALFGESPYWFGVEPTDGAEPKDAREFQGVLGRYLEAPYDESGVNSVINMKMSVRQAQKYGDGFIEVGWDAKNKRPFVDWLDIRDVYFDTTIKGPLIDWSPSVILRKMMTVEDLIDLRGADGVSIPSDEILAYLAAQRSIRVADTTRLQQANARNERLQLFDTRVDPILREVEVLQYWSKRTLIWVLGGQYVSINQPNPYAFIPVCKAPYIPVEGQPWGISQSEMLEADQKYAQGIRNLRLDNLNLAMTPPRTRALGTLTNPSKIAWRPGLIDEVADPKQVDVAKIENFTPAALTEEQVIHSMAQKRFGVNDLISSGVPTPSNANRTGQGVGAQLNATNMRLSTPVKSFEDYMIVPMLYKLQRILQRFAPEVIEMGKSVATKDIVGTPVRFIMRGASKMIVREKLASMVVPVTQTLFNDVIANQARTQGKTLDFDEFERFFQDATGTTEAYRFFRPMNQQEQQQSQMPSPDVLAKMQESQQANQVRMQIAQQSNQTKLQATEMQSETDKHKTAEESAREILKLLGPLLGGKAELDINKDKEKEDDK